MSDMGARSYESILFDAPPIFWRTLGAAACAVVNKDHVTPERQHFMGGTFNTWSHYWTDENGLDAGLIVRETTIGIPGPASLSGFESTDEDGVLTYKRYLFDVVPRTQERKHRLVAFRQMFDTAHVEWSEKRMGKAFYEAIDLGLVRANAEDAQDLYVRLIMAPFSEA